VQEGWVRATDGRPSGTVVARARNAF
jgi:hypothetical protein